MLGCILHSQDPIYRFYAIRTYLPAPVEKPGWVYANVWCCSSTAVSSFLFHPLVQVFVHSCEMSSMCINHQFGIIDKIDFCQWSNHFPIQYYQKPSFISIVHLQKVTFLANIFSLQAYKNCCIFSAKSEYTAAIIWSIIWTGPKGLSAYYTDLC